ncbi:hypothetical protein SAMN00777080_4309 [Aquiflexum balticum DSM 16537]|uniref:Uncharacterized protein n=1 Tax=Aquiflexum balticum DSM 16537 TaxID=758820 RepID=A0A1W2H9T0_9BACT|nr:hypothetical protein SAMN00777080_4309 [Aquiflexum balticum DSM 16537]
MVHVLFEFLRFIFFNIFGTLITLIELIFNDLFISVHQENQLHQRSIFRFLLKVNIFSFITYLNNFLKNNSAVLISINLNEISNTF